MTGFHPVFIVALSILSISFVMAFIRLVRGPDIGDRVVAFDVMTTIGIGFIATYSVATEESLFLDVASVVALVAFLATIAFAYYLKKKE